MTHLSERYLKTGGDPRTLPDYVALRDELGKLSHPARPDVNWHYVEKLSLSLFEQNGVELQTAAWYTLARTQLSGLAGLNEGVSILEALISHQWGNLWPQPVHARVEILSGLSRRVQQMMRTLPLSYSDLSQLYRAEQQLNRLGEVLQRLELKHLSQFDALAVLMHNSAVRLENSDAAQENTAAVPSPVVIPAAGAAPSGAVLQDAAESVKWVYVAQPQARVEVQTPPAVRRSGWKPFTAGMLVMLAVGSASLWGWHVFQRPDPLLLQLDASLSPLPVPLVPAQLQALSLSPVRAENLVQQTQQQLTRTARLVPDWSLDYGQRLVQQAQSLRPDDGAVKQLAQRWQQQVRAAALPLDAMDGWHQGMTQLQQLSARLNALDGKRGKYMTVSELKSEVFAATEAFNRSIPAEEQLRLYSLSPSDIQRRQTEMALEQLQKRYFLLKQMRENPVQPDRDAPR